MYTTVYKINDKRYNLLYHNRSNDIIIMYNIHTTLKRFTFYNITVL